jgi:hypothetical protein
MYLKSLVVIVIVTIFSLQVNAQADPGGIGTSGYGQGAQDITGGAGATSGNQGVATKVISYGASPGAAPIDGGIFLLFAVSAAFAGVSLSGKRMALKG